MNRLTFHIECCVIHVKFNIDCLNSPFARHKIHLKFSWIFVLDYVIELLWCGVWSWERTKVEGTHDDICYPLPSQFFVLNTGNTERNLHGSMHCDFSCCKICLAATMIVQITCQRNHSIPQGVICDKTWFDTIWMGQKKKRFTSSALAVEVHLFCNDPVINWMLCMHSIKKNVAFHM